jgi:beta-lactamase class D
MTRIVRSLVILFCVLLAHAPARADDTVQGRWRARFGKRAGCFVAHEIGSGQTWRSNVRACGRRRPPFSTFKIPHSLIGLDTGVLADAETVIPWDRERHPAEDWWPAEWQETHTLRSAMAHSVVPYYRALAGRIGAEAMKRYLRGFDYGNQAMGPRLDNFWLGGDLAISADEQVAFLTRFHQGRLPVSARAVDIVKDILVLDRTPAYVLRGKTGSGPIGRAGYLGWLVGTVESCGKVYAFALWVEGKTMEAARAERIELARGMLSDLGALPADASECPAAPALQSAPAR